VLGFVDGVANGNASWEVGNISAGKR